MLTAENNKEVCVMNAVETGKRIQELRKMRGWTQKDLADRLHVTDKSVSKWELGKNFPDMAMLEPLARALDTTVVKLLGIENAPEEEKLEAVTAVAVEETQRIRKETGERALIGLSMGIAIWIVLYYLGHLLIEREVYDLPLNICNGLIGVDGILTGNFLWIWWKYRK